MMKSCLIRTKEDKIRILKKQIKSNRLASELNRQAIKGLDEKLVNLVCELKDLEGKNG